MPDVSVVQITVWLGTEQTIEISANAAMNAASGSLIQPCSDFMDFSRSQVAQGPSGQDVQALLQEICGKLILALKQSGATIPICTTGAKIISCPQSGKATASPLGGGR